MSDNGPSKAACTLWMRSFSALLEDVIWIFCSSTALDRCSICSCVATDALSICSRLFSNILAISRISSACVRPDSLSFPICSSVALSNDWARLSACSEVSSNASTARRTALPIFSEPAIATDSASLSWFAAFCPANSMKSASLDTLPIIERRLSAFSPRRVSIEDALSSTVSTAALMSFTLSDNVLAMVLDWLARSCAPLSSACL